MTWLDLYHRLPSFAQNWAASGRGLMLNRWRYGPETDALVEEFEKAEYVRPEDRERIQLDGLREILKSAARRVPYYRDYWQRHQAGGMSVPELAAWPVLTKAEIRRQPERFISDEFQLTSLRLEQTSGSTGAPLRLWHPQTTARRWYSLMEARWRRWYGVSRHDRWAIVGGQLVTPVARRKPPFWVWNEGLKQLYFSAYHLAPENTAAYLKALERYRIVYLLGYPSALATLARFAADQGLAAPPMRVVLSNAEPLFAGQRESIGRVFQCPVRDSYGMSEMVAGASECEQGRLHLWPEAGVVEVLADESDTAVPQGSPGRLVCTGLLNPAMPLVRYEVGDRGILADTGDPCACGRTLPVLQSIEGRSDDVVITPDGREVGRLDPVFKADLAIIEAQIIQEESDFVRVLVVPAAGFTDDTVERIVHALEDRLPAIRIQVERVQRIPRGPNGKFKAVVSRVSVGTPRTNEMR